MKRIHSGIRWMGTRAAILAGCVGWLLAGPAYGQVAAVLRPAPESVSSLGDSPAEIEAFLDGIMDTQLEEHHIAGATIALVDGDEVLLLKGYGYSDVDERAPVVPETTLFRIASVSKLFTWTAVMQLVESGAVDLDTDVNTYLKTVQIPEAYDAPITLRHLLTHTPGFEDSVVGLFGRDENSLRPLDEILNDEMPARVRAPGEVSSYSNHGTAIAGLVIQDVSGMPWEEYIETRVLEPLGMEYASVRQPLPGDLAAHISNGYVWEGGEFVRKDFEFVPAAPAGGMSASAGAMAKFLIAHLNGGAFEGGRILSPETTALMHERIFGHDDRINGFAHGFYEATANGVRIIGHGGDTFWFHSEFMLIPEKGIGLFVSFNSEAGPAARAVLVDAFIDRYFPEEPFDAPEPPSDFLERASRFTGPYASNRYDHSSVAKLGKLMSALTIGVTDDGYLTIATPDGPTKWVETEPLLFHEVDGDGRLVFRENAEGEITHLFMDGNPTSAMEPLDDWEAPLLQNLLPALCLALLASFWVLPVLAMIARAYYRQPLEKRLPMGARIVGLVATGLCIGFGAALAGVMMDPRDIAFGPTAAFYTAMGLGMVAAVGVVLMVFATFWIWVTWKGTWVARGYYTLCAAAGMGLIAWMWHWNILGVWL